MAGGADLARDNDLWAQRQALPEDAVSFEAAQRLLGQALHVGPVSERDRIEYFNILLSIFEYLRPPTARTDDASPHLLVGQARRLLDWSARGLRLVIARDHYDGRRLDTMSKAHLVYDLAANAGISSREMLNILRDLDQDWDTRVAAAKCLTAVVDELPVPDVVSQIGAALDELLRADWKSARYDWALESLARALDRHAGENEEAQILVGRAVAALDREITEWRQAFTSGPPPVHWAGTAPR